MNLNRFYFSILNLFLMDHDINYKIIYFKEEWI